MGAPPRSHRMQMGPTGNVKSDFKAYVRLVVVLIFFALFVFGFFRLLNVQKEEATIQEVELAMIEQGYTPRDLTEVYYNQDSGFKTSLKKCIAMQKDDIRLHFFEFKDSESAKNIYRQAYNNAILKYDSFQKIERHAQMGSFSIYTLDSKGMYSVAIYVGNTAISANSNPENKGEINAILSKIDYLEP